MTFPRALVVDDSPVMRLIGEKMCIKLGFIPTSVANGREAVETAGKTAFPVILMDCQMPEMDGLQATLLIRQHEKELSQHALIVAVTAAYDRQECFAAGMDDFIQKPLTVAGLEETLKRWGWKEIDTLEEMQRIREVLNVRQHELSAQTAKLAAAHIRLDRFRQNLAQIPARISREQKLQEWEASLEAREWALRKRELFLRRREETVGLSVSERFGRVI